VNKLFGTYKVLAYVVGVLLLVGTISSLFKYLLPEGTALQSLGEAMTPLWVAHGWIFIIYVIVAFLLTQKARWTIPEFLLMMIAGLIPGLICWVERRVAARIAPKLTEGATS
jgi:integral membrane protein